MLRTRMVTRGALCDLPAASPWTPCLSPPEPPLAPSPTTTTSGRPGEELQHLLPQRIWPFLANVQCQCHLVSEPCSLPPAPPPSPGTPPSNAALPETRSGSAQGPVSGHRWWGWGGGGAGVALDCLLSHVNTCKPGPQSRLAVAHLQSASNCATFNFWHDPAKGQPMCKHGDRRFSDRRSLIEKRNSPHTHPSTIYSFGYLLLRVWGGGVQRDSVVGNKNGRL